MKATVKWRPRAKEKGKVVKPGSQSLPPRGAKVVDEKRKKMAPNATISGSSPSEAVLLQAPVHAHALPHAPPHARALGKGTSRAFFHWLMGQGRVSHQRRRGSPRGEIKDVRYRTKGHKQCCGGDLFLSAPALKKVFKNSYR